MNRVLSSFKMSLGVLELVFAGMLWGLGFVTAAWAIEGLSPTATTVCRYGLCVVVGLILCSRWSWAQIRSHFKWSFFPALCLTTMLLFQTWGLLTTSPMKSGFITILYVVLVPLFESLVWKRRLARWLWVLIALSLTGTALIVRLNVHQQWAPGDLLTVVCAFAAAGHILVIDRIQNKISEPFLFNVTQSAWGLLFCLLIWPLTWAWYHPAVTVQFWRVGLGVLLLGLGSTTVAFYLQVRAQKVLPPTVSSLLFLLESPFAALFAWWLLENRLTGREEVGAALIFTSALLASFFHVRSRKKRPRQNAQIE